MQPEYMSRLAGCSAKHILFAGPCAVHVRYGVDLDPSAIGYSDGFAECRYEHIWLVGGFKHFLFSTIYGIIFPIDFHIFQRGGSTTNQFNYLFHPLIHVISLSKEDLAAGLSSVLFEPGRS